MLAVRDGGLQRLSDLQRDESHNGSTGHSRGTQICPNSLESDLASPLSPPQPLLLLFALKETVIWDLIGPQASVRPEMTTSTRTSVVDGTGFIIASPLCFIKVTSLHCY